MAEGIESDDDMAAENGSDKEQQPEPTEAPRLEQGKHSAAAPAQPAEPALPGMDSEVYLDEEMSLGEGALQPLEVEYEQPPLTAGGTVTKVSYRLASPNQL